MENRYNLIDEPWIPVAAHGRVSLRQVFNQSEYRSLGGNPVQKIALLKLLLAIAQAAATPEDDGEWKALGSEGLAKRCSEYLDKWYDRFYLYGDRPFLQMPKVIKLIKLRTEKRIAASKTASKKYEAISSGLSRSIGTGLYPDLPSSNNTVFSHTLFDREITDAERAVFLISVMNFAFGGKRVEADMLSLGGIEMGNRYSASAGPSLGGWSGQLHCIPVTDSIQSDIWINLLTQKNVKQLNRWPTGLGIPPWENMPESENDNIASEHKESYQASLVALSRFVFLEGNGVYYLDGLKYRSVKDGWFEPSLIIDNSSSDIKVKYSDPENRPWRELQGLLAFMSSDHTSGFECYALKNGINRIRDYYPRFAIWCLGIKVSSNSGDQSVKQRDDFVESKVWLNSDALGSAWFVQLKIEMIAMELLADRLKTATKNYFKQLINWKKGQKEPVIVKSMGDSATNLFWQLSERNFQTLVDSCDQDERSNQQRRELRSQFAAYVHQAYDQFCPKETARQLDAWAKCQPNNRKYLKQEA